MLYTDLKKRGQLKIIKLREKAIKRYENGESPKEICQSLGKGKTWLFKCFRIMYVTGKVN